MTILNEAIHSPTLIPVTSRNFTEILIVSENRLNLSNPFYDVAILTS